MKQAEESQEYYTDIDQWEIINSFLNIQDAYMARAYLEAAGIRVLLRDELSTQVGYCANAIGGVKILVPGEQLQEAVAYLEKGGYIVCTEKQAENSCEVVEDPDRIDICPFCHSHNIAEEKIGWGMRFILKVLDILFLTYYPHWICFDCGKEWKFRITYRRKE